MNQKNIFSDIKISHFIFVSNLITIVRMFLTIPIFFALRNHDLSMVVIYIAICIFTDFLDGYFARKRNEVSELGKILDPMSDKTVIIFTTFALMESYGLPLWLGTFIVIRDFFIVIGSVFLSSKTKMVNPSNIIGKITVNIIALNLICYMFNFSILIPYINWLSFLFILLSITSYLIEGLKKIKEQKNS